MIETCTPMYETGMPKKAKANQRIREALKEAGLYQWELAILMGVCEATLQKRIRVELPEEEQDRIIELIRENRKEG